MSDGAGSELHCPGADTSCPCDSAGSFPAGAELSLCGLSGGTAGDGGAGLHGDSAAEAVIRQYAHGDGQVLGGVIPGAEGAGRGAYGAGILPHGPHNAASGGAGGGGTNASAGPAPVGVDAERQRKAMSAAHGLPSGLVSPGEGAFSAGSGGADGDAELSGLDGGRGDGYGGEA